MTPGARSDKIFQKGKERNNKRRSIGNRGKPKEVIFIACEGKTEALYFSDFKPLKNIRITAQSLGCQNIKLVEKAVNMKSDGYKEIWCVFDYDVELTNPDKRNQVEKAFSEAKKHEIKIAFTNDAFELWFLLHYIPCTSSMHRRLIEKKLKGFVKKYNETLPGMYKRLIELQPTAVKNARMCFSGKKASAEQVDINPSTSVHLLVEELNKYL